MPHYELNGTVFYYDTTDAAAKYNPSARGITDEEAHAILNPIKPIAARQIERWELIKARRTTVENGGVLVATKWFHTDRDSRIKHLGLVMMGAAIPVGTMWKTMDGTFIEMTQTLAGQVFEAIAQLDSLAFSNAETHRIAMESSVTPETYDYSTDWPTVFTG